MDDDEVDVEWDDFVIVDTIELDENEEAKPEFIPEVTFDLIGVED